MPTPNGRVYPLPPSPPDWVRLSAEDGLKKLKEYLQIAVLVELYTIPLYLFAAYSIIPNKDKESPESNAIGKIIGITKQEMLHLGLAGNILRAIGGKPKIYGTGITPHYPEELFYDDEVLMELKRANTDQIKLFVRLEAPLSVGAPAEAPAETNLNEYGPSVLDYDSIGTFYEATRIGLAIVAEKYMIENPGKTIFDSSVDGNQFQTSDSYLPDLTTIHNLKGAEDALKLIMEQGEGSSIIQGGPEDPASHWVIFKKILATGELNCYPVVDNPKTKNYKDTAPKVYKVMLVSDAVYSYLLLTMEYLWDNVTAKRDSIIEANMTGLMRHIIRNLATFLVKQKLDRTPFNAAAPFNLYEFKPGSSACQQVQALYKDAAAENDLNSLPGLQKAVHDLIDIGV